MGAIEEVKQDEIPKMKLQILPERSKHDIARKKQSYLAIISSTLTSNQDKLLNILKEHKKGIGWTLKGIKGTNLLNWTNKIHLKDNVKTYRQSQIRFKSFKKKMVKIEIFKFLDLFIPCIPRLETSADVKKRRDK